MVLINLIFRNTTVRTFPYWAVKSFLRTSAVNAETVNIPKEKNNVAVRNSEEDAAKARVLQAVKNQIEAAKKSKKPTVSDQGLDKQITEARNAAELISIMKNPSVTMDHVRKILSLIPSKTLKNEGSHSIVEEGAKLTAEDVEKKELEGPKNLDLIIPLSTPMLVKFLKQLSTLKQRNPMMLKPLIYNITTYSDKLNIRLCGDILYSLAKLNYVDEPLLKKIMSDLKDELDGDVKGPMIGSILTSLSVLKYRNTEILDSCSSWAYNNIDKMRSEDLTALIRCCATFGYYSPILDDIWEVVYAKLQSKVQEPETWITLIWCLTILNKATPSLVESVLNKNVVARVLCESSPLYTSLKLKLLNINAAARHLLQDYNGPYLEPDKSPTIIGGVPKQKQDLIEALNETMKEITSSSFRISVDTKMGFSIDAECFLDSDKNFQRCTNIDMINVSETTRLAIMIHSYFDYSRGEEELLGLTNFYNNILSAQGYKILNISYRNFSTSDKLIKRVIYIRDHINSLLK